MTDPAPDLAHWQGKLNAARDAQWATLKAAADKWAGTLAVLIGAVGSISVIVVPKALDDFSNDTMRGVTFALVLVAGAAALAALLCATTVAQGWPKVDATMDAAKYKQQTLDHLASGVGYLTASRWLTLGALVCVVAASVLSQLDTLTASPSGVNVLVVNEDGTVKCVVGDQVVRETAVTSATVVAHC